MRFQFLSLLRIQTISDRIRIRLLKTSGSGQISSGDFVGGNML
jgi:hypothetical protein